MAYLNNDIFDNGLTELSTATSVEMHVISEADLPSDRAAVLAASLASHSLIGGDITAPADVTVGDGREVTISSIEDMIVDSTGQAERWALIDGTRLLATDTFNNPQQVQEGNSINLTSFKISFTL